MPLIESIVTKLAIDVIKWLVNQNIKTFTDSEYNEYEKELIDVISSSITLFKQKYDVVTKSGKIHFCTSQIVLTELLKFRISQFPNINDLNKAIQSDKRVEPPTEDELKNFLEIFSENLNKSSKINVLNIENNYKEEIFNISAQLKTFSEAISNLKKEGPIELIEEWIKRLDEVTSNIEKFKPKTALDIIERLETSISTKGILVEDTLKGKIIYLKAICENEIQSRGIEKEAAEKFITAHNYCPLNFAFKINAGLGYLVLGETAKAVKLAKEIIEKEEFHPGAWAIKIFSKGPDFRHFLNKIPINVRNKLEFKAQVGYWIMTKKYINNITDLDALGLNLEITNENIPKLITYKNKWFWEIAVLYLINKIYELNPIIKSNGFDTYIIDDVNYKYLNDILNKIVNAVDGSEIENNYIWYKFQKLLGDFYINKDKNNIANLESTFNKIRNKQSTDIIQMGQVYNSFGTLEYTSKTIKLIEDFAETSNPTLCMFSSYNYLILNNITESIVWFKYFLALYSIIDEKVFYNIIEYLNFLQEQSPETVIDIKVIVKSKTFDPPALKDLYEILTNYSNLEINIDEACFENIKTQIDSNNENLRFYIALGYYLNHMPNETAAYLNNKIDKTKPSKELKLYCQSLFVGDGDKLELLSIIERWRKIYSLDYDLVRIELMIRELLNRWDIYLEIAEQALLIFPEDEYLIFTYFHALDNIGDFERIKNNLSFFHNRTFDSERIGIALFRIILNAGFSTEALKLLYNLASKKKNVQARSLYVSSSIYLPQDFFNDYPTVKIGTYVEYELDGKNVVIFIDNESSQTELGKALMNKTVDDTTIVGTKAFSGKQISVKIIKIMNQFTLLFREILKEAENPLSGHKLELIKIDSTDTDSINKSLIESLGEMGSMKKNFSENEFEKYYKRTSSFTEITSLIFDNNRFDAYFYLTSPLGKQFMAISPNLSNSQSINDESKFVLDFTSVCLFFQLSNKFALKFKHKFIISASIKKELSAVITKTKLNPEPKLSINITKEGVVPYLYQEGNKEVQLEFLGKLIEWLNEYCEIDFVEEKLNLMLKKHAQGQEINNIHHDLIDIQFLVDRPNYFILSNDLFYYTNLNLKLSNILSPEFYLSKYHSKYILECSKFMLKSNYVGITIHFDILKNEYINMIHGKENKYQLCLENLDYKWNPNLEHVNVISRFIKWICLSNDIDKGNINNAVFTLLISSLKTAPPNFILTLREELNKQLSEYIVLKLHVNLILLQAVQFIQKTK
ncbi:MAG TPA: hypothetical protein PKA44_07505 [Saprospiraceae bacterium]|nr:hypothetical protein [Saprospiraceae bacterium]